MPLCQQGGWTKCLAIGTSWSFHHQNGLSFPFFNITWDVILGSAHNCERKVKGWNVTWEKWNDSVFVDAKQWRDFLWNWKIIGAHCNPEEQHSVGQAKHPADYSIFNNNNNKRQAIDDDIEGGGPLLWWGSGVRGKTSSVAWLLWWVHCWPIHMPRSQQRWTLFIQREETAIEKQRKILSV